MQLFFDWYEDLSRNKQLALLLSLLIGGTIWGQSNYEPGHGEAVVESPTTEPGGTPVPPGQVVIQTHDNYFTVVGSEDRNPTTIHGFDRSNHASTSMLGARVRVAQRAAGRRSPTGRSRHIRCSTFKCRYSRSVRFLSTTI